jgi:uncharacterized RDD family membrane protein YckC
MGQPWIPPAARLASERRDEGGPGEGRSGEEPRIPAAPRGSPRWAPPTGARPSVGGWLPPAEANQPHAVPPAGFPPGRYGRWAPPREVSPHPPAGGRAPPAGTFAGARLASWPARAGALLLAALITIVPAIVIATIVDAVIDTAAGNTVSFGLFLALVSLAVPLLYAPPLLARHGRRNGQTLGKQIARIRVVRDDGAPLGYGAAALREFLIKYVVIGLLGGGLLIPPLLDGLWPLWDGENRALHDMLASTHVVRT